MVLLIQHPVSPQSRKLRIGMSEKKMLFILRNEEPWNLSPDIYKLNPAGDLPVFLNDGMALCGHNAIMEYLEETSREVKLMPETPRERAEVRRLIDWFDYKFYHEVYKNIVCEKVHKRFAKGLAPDSKILKIGLNNLNFHMEYIDWLTERRNYLAGENLTWADIAAAAHLSIIDYLGDAPWDGYRNAKLWYSKIKSRPSFKDILKDNIKGILPSKHYADLDF